MKDFKEVERISKLIVKRRLGRISEKETKELQEWENRSPGHTTLSEKWLSADYLGEDYAEFTSIDSKRAEAEMRSRSGLIVKKESRRRKLILRFSAAAAILVVLGVALTLSLRTSVPEIEDVIVGAPLPAQEVVLITGNTSVPLANNAELILSNEGTISIVGNEGDAGVKLAASEMNRLIVPFGKLSSLTLPDGSKVWLNAGSELEFPTKFAANGRAVTLSGEMYIEVARDPSRPFVVNTHNLKVQVLGTMFNISSYASDDVNSVVLAEGSVSIDYGNGTQRLSPGQIFEWNGQDYTVKRADVSQYTSWKDGYILANKTPVTEILEKISRYYNVEFEYDRLRIINKTCTGRLILTDDLANIMQVISDLSGTTYQQDDQTIHLN